MATIVVNTFTGDLAAWEQHVGAWSINSETERLEAVNSDTATESGILRNLTPLDTSNHQVVATIFREGGGVSIAGVFGRGSADGLSSYLGRIERVADDSYRLEIRLEESGGGEALVTGSAFVLTDQDYAAGIEMTLTIDLSTITLALTSPVQSVTIEDTELTSGSFVGIYGRLFNTLRHSWGSFIATDQADIVSPPEVINLSSSIAQGVSKAQLQAEQSPNEQVPYHIDVSRWARSPSSPEVLQVVDLTDHANVKSTVMPAGEPTFILDGKMKLLLPPLRNVTLGHQYQIEIAFTGDNSNYLRFHIIAGGR